MKYIVCTALMACLFVSGAQAGHSQKGGRAMSTSRCVTPPSMLHRMVPSLAENEPFMVIERDEEVQALRHLLYLISTHNKAPRNNISTEEVVVYKGRDEYVFVFNHIGETMECSHSLVRAPRKMVSRVLGEKLGWSM